MDIYEEAKQRGMERRERDLATGGLTMEPLSGEWAGESIPELLGDLLTDDNWDDICDAYEQGYFHNYN